MQSSYELKNPILHLPSIMLATAGLGQLYGGANADWLWAAIINSSLLLAVYPFLAHPLFAKSFRPQKKLPAYFYYLPSIALLLAATILGIFCTFLPNRESGSSLDLKHLAWIIWIPPLEEGLFRLGLGNFLRNILGFWPGSYLAVLIFVILHGPFGFVSLGHLQFSFSFGVFLMAIICDALYNLSDSLLPAIAFHAACNTTIPIFTMSDPRIFDWLSLFY